MARGADSVRDNVRAKTYNFRCLQSTRISGAAMSQLKSGGGEGRTESPRHEHVDNSDMRLITSELSYLHSNHVPRILEVMVCTSPFTVA